VALPERVRRVIYAISGGLCLIGIFAMRWNVIIGGQFYSKSLLGFTAYKMGWAGREGLLAAVGVLVLAFVILAVLIRLLPPWPQGGTGRAGGMNRRGA
jgi:predicted membrane protein